MGSREAALVVLVVLVVRVVLVVACAAWRVVLVVACAAWWVGLVGCVVARARSVVAGARPGRAAGWSCGALA